MYKLPHPTLTLCVQLGRVFGRVEYSNRDYPLNKLTKNMSRYTRPTTMAEPNKTRAHLGQFGILLATTDTPGILSPHFAYEVVPLTLIGPWGFSAKYMSLGGFEANITFQDHFLLHALHLIGHLIGIVPLQFLW